MVTQNSGRLPGIYCTAFIHNLKSNNMNLEIKLAFRKLLSDALMYMCQKDRDKNEILTMMDKLEKATSEIIKLELTTNVPGTIIIPSYKMKDAERIVYRQNIAITLEKIQTPGIKPESVLDMINQLENWVENEVGRVVAIALGKPKMTISRLN